MVKVGDWVNVRKVKSGYVLAVNKEHVTVQYKTHTATVRLQDIKPWSVQLSEEDIDGLIDLALATGDEQWFMYLISKREKNRV